MKQVSGEIQAQVIRQLTTRGWSITFSKGSIGMKWGGIFHKNVSAKLSTRCSIEVTYNPFEPDAQAILAEANYLRDLLTSLGVKVLGNS